MQNQQIAQMMNQAAQGMTINLDSKYAITFEGEGFRFNGEGPLMSATTVAAILGIAADTGSSIEMLDAEQSNG